MKKNECQKQKRLFVLKIAVLLCGTLLFLNELFPQDTTTQSQPVIQLSGVGITWVIQNGETTFSSTNVVKDEIQDALGNGSINNLFELIPSMVTTSDAGTGIGYTYMRIRGIDQTRINVTVNGIALNDGESQGSWFVNLPDFGSHVNNLVVQRGVGTSNNGSAAFGASMNFNTSSVSENPSVELSSSAGSFYTFRNAVSVSSGLINKRLSSSISYSNIQSRGFIDRADAHLHSLFFTTQYRLLFHEKMFGKINFNILYGNEKTGLAWNGVPSDSLKTNRTYNDCGAYYDAADSMRYYDNETDNYQQTHYQLFYDIDKILNFQREDKTVSHHFRFDVGGHLTRGIGYYEEYKDDKSLSSYGLSPLVFTDTVIEQSDLVTRKYLDNYFYGLTFNFKHQILFLNKLTDKEQTIAWSIGGAMNRYDGKHYGTINWMQYAGAIPVNAHWYDGTGDKKQFNLFGTVSYQTKLLYTYLDLQYRRVDYQIAGTDDNLSDISQAYLWNFFNPKAGINLSLGNDSRHNLYLSFAIAHREPTRTDIVDAPSQNKPKPETVYDCEMGYRFHYKKYNFNVNIYDMYYRDQLVLTGLINDVGDAIMTNVKRSYRAGVELVSCYAPFKFFTWKVNGTISMNKILDYTEYVDDWDTGEQRENYLGTTNISFSPNLIVGNEFEFTVLKHFNIALNTKYVSKQFIDNSNNSQYVIKPYCITDLHLSYEIFTEAIPSISFFFHLNNIFNAKYESNAWLYRYYEQGQEYSLNGYYPQAGINFMVGLVLKFDRIKK